MKNAVKLFGIIALAAVIGFSMIGCGGDDSGGGGGFVGAELKFDGQQVVTGDFNEDTLKISYKNFNGDLDIDDGGLGGDGEIKGGKFSYSIGDPDTDYMVTLAEFYEDDDDITVSSDTVQATMLQYFEIIDSPTYDYLMRGLSTVNVNKQTETGKFTNEFVYFVYVDGDVTVSDKGFKESGVDEEDDHAWEENYKAYSLKLKEGWNAVHVKMEENFTETKSTGTTTTSLGNPGSLKWILSDEDGFGFSVQQVTPHVSKPSLLQLPSMQMKRK